MTGIGGKFGFGVIGLVSLVAGSNAFAGAKKPAATPSGLSELYQATWTTSEGKTVSAADYKGKVLLIANTASECGYTPQYAGLQSVYEKYKDRGFIVLAFPSNDFGRQEPGSNEQIKKFCVTNYKVSFPLMAKAPVSGAEAQPTFRWLTEQSSKDGDVSWNFEKFIISKAGQVAARFRSRVRPGDREVLDVIERELGK